MRNQLRRCVYNAVAALGIGGYAARASLSLIDCILTNNIHAGDQYQGGRGGGFYALDSSLLIRNLTVANNRVGGGSLGLPITPICGAGLAFDRGFTRVWNSVIRDNESRCYSTLWGSARGGGINVKGVVILRNVLLTGNRATVRTREGNALYLEGGDLRIENCTVTTNFNDVRNGAALHRGAGVATVHNSIFWNNIADFNSLSGISGAYSLSTQWEEGVAGNLTADPLFVGATGGNFRLTLKSPAVDAGSNAAWMLTASDLDQTARIKAHRVDLGAYEIQPLPNGSIYVLY